VYSIEEVLEMNDLTPEEALEYMFRNGFISLPEIQPLDF
jgi:hypothetical protein